MTEKQLIGSDKQINAIYSTMDYDKFNNIAGNRILNKRNYSKLLKSMSEKQLEIPIICSIIDGKLTIIDGQHRFSSSRELGLPIIYTIVDGYGLEELKRANQVSSNWTKADFLNLFLEELNQDYIDFAETMNKYGINLYSLLRICAIVKNETVNSISYQFENGILTFDTWTKLEVEKFFDMLEDFHMFNDYKSKSFISAFSKLYAHEVYDHDMMKRKLTNRGTMLQKCGNEMGYLNILCNEVYSYGLNSRSIRYVSGKFIVG